MNAFINTFWVKKNTFTRGLFWRPGIVITCICVCTCVCACVCVNTGFVREITHHPFKLDLPNSDKGCKTPWLVKISIVLGGH